MKSVEAGNSNLDSVLNEVDNAGFVVVERDEATYLIMPLGHTGRASLEKDTLKQQIEAALTEVEAASHTGRA